MTGRAGAASTLSLVLVGGLWWQPIITRHDRSDEAYLELGVQYGAGVVAMNLEAPGGASDGHGTLIAPRWVVTAAHVAVEVRVGHLLTVGGRDVAAEAVIPHPEWTEGAAHDIALIRLAESVTEVGPVPLYDRTDEVARTVIVVGRGDIGTGLTGPTGNDARLRGGTNRVDGASERHLWWRFDAPADSGVTELEGISGPGDSGGPAFLDVEGTLRLAGVSSAQSSRATGGRNGVYGVTEYYVRVSSYVGWIERTMRDGPGVDGSELEEFATFAPNGA